MADPTKEPPIDLGIYNQQDARSGITSAEVIAIVLSGVWVIAVAGFFYFFDTSETDAVVISGWDTQQFVVVLLAVFLPIAVIWVGASTVKSARIMREESARLQAAIDALRHAYVTQQQTTGVGGRPSVEDKLDQIAAAQKQTESAIATFTSIREPSRLALANHKALEKSREISADEQASLALGTRAEDIAPPISNSDFIRALHFPENADDVEGFDALRRALRDRQTAKLVQSSQDILTLLSQEGIYMDDLRPDRARADVWRKFAHGERGREVAALGGVRDRSCLALTAGRMRSDPIFRDTAHHFLRKFDTGFSSFEETATDQEISELSDTRTARAFMLLGRVSGTFD